MKPWHALLLTFALIASAVTLRWPWMHRAIWNLDEGSTFTMAQQVLEGDVLYRDAADNRSPLLPCLKAAIFAVAGNWNAFAVHVVLAVLLGGCAVVLWRLARRLGDETTGLAAAAIFTVLSIVMLDPPDALSANTGWFLVIFSTLGFGAFARALAQPSFSAAALSGVFFGLSFLCKQPGLLDFGVTWVLLALLAFSQPGQGGTFLRLWFALLAGAATPVLLFVAYFAAHGALADMVYYVFTYNTTIYVPEVPRLERLAMMRRPFELVFAYAPVVFILALGAAAGLLTQAWQGLRAKPARVPVLVWLVLGWAAAGIVATGLSGRGFSHYSAQVVPAFSLAAGWAVARVIERARRATTSPRARRLILALLFVAAGALATDYVRRSGRLDAANDFTQEVGALVAAHSAPAERLFVWGYFPEFYFFSQRLPATRFVYTVFVTGMIPWTNLDPLVDTAYASVPGSADKLMQDFHRRPPAVVVDSGRARGYIKYPLHDETALWDVIQKEFGQVEVDAMRRVGMRLFRRLVPVGPAPLPSGLPENLAVELSGFSSDLRREPPRLRVRAPAGVTRLELFAANTPIAALDHPADRAVDTLFFVPPTVGDSSALRVVTVSATGPTVSAPFDFQTFAGRLATRRLAGPRLQLGDRYFSPLIDRAEGPPSPSPSLPDTWRVDPPAELEYPCPVGLAGISFIHGQEPAAQGMSDGYDLLVEFHGDDGRRLNVWQQRLHPRTVGDDQRPQPVQFRLPPHGPGRLVFRFLAGEHNSPEYDWIFFGQLKGFADGPAITLGEKIFLPTLGLARGNEPITPSTPPDWGAHTPSRIEWPRPDSLVTLNFNYGLEEGAYTSRDGHTDGVDFSLDLVGDDGETRRLFARSLTPFNHPEQRGPQRARVELPAHVPGRLVFRADPGPNQDASWDWAWVGGLTGEGPGPDIVVSPERRIPAESSRVLDGSVSKHDGPDRWGAHADCELVYQRPGELARVTFTYGLADGAARDETGKRRSDGVVVVVEFTPAGQPVREIFRRSLDPFANPADFGPQTSTIDLPPWQEGRLVFRILRGPYNDASFDWAFWGPFSGETR